MARITEEELARLKAGVSLERLCSVYGIELKGHGKDLLGRCPFHEDRTPSFVVTPGKNLWNCLGACGCGGDNLQLVMKKEGVSFRRAVERLREMLGEAPPVAVVKTRLGTQHAALVVPGMELEDAELLGHVADYYHQTFLNEAAAMAYLQKRKCFHPEAVKVFRLGFANRTLGYRVPATTAEGRKLKGQLQRLGVLRGTGHEHLNGSVIVPLWACGPDGEPGPVAQLYGRKITANLREGTPEHLYLPGPQRGVWNAAGVAGQREWLVCEALLDALTLWCAGFRNVTSAYGVNGWTAEHWALFDAKPPERVILCFDNDEAGNQAAMRLAEEMELRGVKVWRAKLPPGKDINEVARESGDASAALAEVIEAAPRIFALNAPEVKAKASEAPPVESKPEVSSAPATAEEIPSSLAALAAAASPLAAETEDVEPEEATKKKSPEPAEPDAHAWTFGERQWRVRGIAKNPSYETLRVQLRVLVEKRTGPVFHLDTLDLCNAKHRANFVEAAHLETGVGAEHLKRDLAQVLLKAEEQQEAHLRKTSEPTAKTVTLNPAEETAALGLLRDPRLLDRILEDFERCGVVGEATNKLVGYLAAVSRKLDAPLAVIVQSTSAAGKSSLLEAVLAFVPEEERIKYSAMTGQSLYYLGDTELKHKVLAIVEEEGAERASYALKLLQSEGELTIASTGKDPHSGRMVTQEYHVQGPVMILLTTTAIDVDEELLNRCLVLTVDESREQTRAIHELQREARTLEGLRRKLDKTAILTAHRNAQRLLKPVRVVNPWARRLTFIDDRTRTRRDHEKYLTLIDAIAFLHQYQRPVRQGGGRADYIEATLEDIATANRLAGEVLGRSLDELPPQTRRLLRLIDDLVSGECRRLKIQRGDYRFSRRDVRAFTGWGNTQLKVHLHRLEEMEYLLVHRGGRGQSFVYELLYAGEGTDGSRFLPGLLDVTNLGNDGNRSGQNGNWSGSNDEKSASGRGQVGPKPGGVGVGPIASEPCKHEAGEAVACVAAHFCATGEKKSDAEA